MSAFRFKMPSIFWLNKFRELVRDCRLLRFRLLVLIDTSFKPFKSLKLAIKGYEGGRKENKTVQLHVCI